ncbi:Intron-binding protein aquarius [Porphyridium purpureum]|uniref:Intron-binding protein aquarius n=1 Tax=Porphyridium purpureum TaxID=35688 RepID=A0A5J4Z306_PORPP|nr:Intron-binding protein aquarius [Porphyridium purpureum]|eukprot:POR6661..scf295_1
MAGPWGVQKIAARLERSEHWLSNQANATEFLQHVYAYLHVPEEHGGRATSRAAVLEKRELVERICVPAILDEALFARKPSAHLLFVTLSLVVVNPQRVLHYLRLLASSTARFDHKSERKTALWLLFSHFAWLRKKTAAGVGVRTCLFVHKLVVFLEDCALNFNASETNSQLRNELAGVFGKDLCLDLARSLLVLPRRSLSASDPDGNGFPCMGETLCLLAPHPEIKHQDMCVQARLLLSHDVRENLRRVLVPLRSILVSALTRQPRIDSPLGILVYDILEYVGSKSPGTCMCFLPSVQATKVQCRSNLFPPAIESFVNICSSFMTGEMLAWQLYLAPTSHAVKRVKANDALNLILDFCDRDPGNTSRRSYAAASTLRAVCGVHTRNDHVEAVLAKHDREWLHAIGCDSGFASTAFVNAVIAKDVYVPRLGTYFVSVKDYLMRVLILAKILFVQELLNSKSQETHMRTPVCSITQAETRDDLDFSMTILNDKHRATLSPSEWNALLARKNSSFIFLNGTQMEDGTYPIFIPALIQVHKCQARKDQVGFSMRLNSVNELQELRKWTDRCSSEQGQLENGASEACVYNCKSASDVLHLQLVPAAAGSTYWRLVQVVLSLFHNHAAQGARAGLYDNEMEDELARFPLTKLFLGKVNPSSDDEWRFLLRVRDPSVSQREFGAYLTFCNSSTANDVLSDMDSLSEAFEISARLVQDHSLNDELQVRSKTGGLARVRQSNLHLSDLYHAQQQAVYSSVYQQLTVVIGPPGCGKTLTAAHCASHAFRCLLEEHKVSRQERPCFVLLVTQSNLALDQLLLRTAHLLQDDKVVARNVITRLGGFCVLPGAEAFALDAEQKVLKKQMISDRDILIELASKLDFCERACPLCDAWGALLDSLCTMSGSACEVSSFEAGSFLASTRGAHLEALLVSQNEADEDQIFERIEHFAKFLQRPSGTTRQHGCDELEDFAALKRVWIRIAAAKRSMREFRYGHAENALLSGSNSPQVIAATFACLAGKYEKMRQVGARVYAAVVEEAGRANELESFPLLALCPERLMLVGDDLQLPPLVVDEHIRDYGNFAQPLFSRFRRIGVPPILLDYQARARHELANLYRFRYSVSSGTQTLKDLNRSSDWKHPEHVSHFLQFINSDRATVSGCSKCTAMAEAPVSKRFESETNPAECAQIVSFSAFLVVVSKIPPDEIAILTPYRAQKELIRKHLESHWMHLAEQGCHGLAETVSAVEVATVDEYQGLEREVVLISLVKTRPTDMPSNFLCDARRINVLSSRARSALYMFGSDAVLQKSYEWRQILDRIAVKGELALSGRDRRREGETSSDYLDRLCVQE